LQGRNRYNSFCYPDGAGWKLDAQERPADKKGRVKVNLRLTKIGTVKLHLHRDMIGTIKTLTIKREGEHWYAIFACEIGKPEPLPTSHEDVGIDLGVATLLQSVSSLQLYSYSYLLESSNINDREQRHFLHHALF